MEKPLIVILGPTASGKTSLAIQLAKKFGGEIISADSRTIYENMDIGTAKPTRDEQKVIPHYLLDIIKPDQRFSVAEFQKLAFQKIAEILKRGKIPFLIGGSGLYIDAVCEGFKIPALSADKKLRKKLVQKSETQLIKQLKKLDPEATQKIDVKNKRRIIRALEVCLTTGKKFSELQRSERPDFQILKIGIKIPRQKLYQQINKRTGQMIKEGLVDEVKKLYKIGYDFNLPALSGLVYKEIGEYVRGKITLDEAVEKAKQKTRNFAKRQMTWFRRDSKIKWVSNPEQAKKLIIKFLK